MSGVDPARLARLRTHFDRYVEDGRLPGWLAVVHRDGEVAHLDVLRPARPRGRPARSRRTRSWRIYSMTKPITSVAAMMLWEEGAFELKDPVSALAARVRRHARVPRAARWRKAVTEPATEPIPIWHLLTHTSGLTYGFHHAHPVDALYRAAGFEWGSPPGIDLAGVLRPSGRSCRCCSSPAREWNYCVSTDVLGRVVEVVSGQPLDEFLAAADLRAARHGRHRLLRRRAPTHDRLAALYVPDPDDRARSAARRLGAAAPQPPDVPLRRRRARLDAPRTTTASRSMLLGGGGARRRAAARPAHAAAT